MAIRRAAARSDVTKKTLDNIMEHYGLGEYALPLEVQELARAAATVSDVRHEPIEMGRIDVAGDGLLVDVGEDVCVGDGLLCLAVVG